MGPWVLGSSLLNPPRRWTQKSPNHLCARAEKENKHGNNSIRTGTRSECFEFVARTHKILINGKWVEAASGKTFPTYNPATGDVLSRVAEGDKEDIDRAVKAARAAFETGPWSKITPSERGRMIWKLGDLIEKHLEEFAQLESLDNGKPLTVARVADVPLAADHFRYMAGWATKIEGNTIPISSGGGKTQFLAYTVREPIGVVGQIIPWNFPLLMAAWKLGPALATGCTVVLKPAEQTPLTALLLGELIQEAGIPDGVVNIVPGLRRNGRRGACGASGRRQSRLHRFHGSRQADPAGRRRQSEKSFAGTRRKIAQHRAATMPMSMPPFPAPPAPFSSITASAAARARASTSKAIFSTKSWTASRNMPATFASAPEWIPRATWGRSFPKNN